jgi:hypothetical protein
MKALRMALVTGMLAGAAGCSRPPPAPAPAAAPAASAAAPVSAYDGPATLAYLEAVGAVRSKANTDNRNRIPALIRGQDLVMLGNEAERIAQYRQTLSALPVGKVDPDALQFEKNFESILAAYESVCTDSAELFREAARTDAQKPDSTPLMGQIRSGFVAMPVDTIGAASKLVEIVQRIASTQTGYLPITAMLEKVGDDRDKLVGAKETHRAFALKVKGDFAQRYPAVDWSAKEVLPP